MRGFSLKSHKQHYNMLNVKTDHVDIYMYCYIGPSEEQMDFASFAAVGTECGHFRGWAQPSFPI